MDTKEFLQRSYDHVMAQTERSNVDGGVSCLYAGPKGNSCAIGCVLPRELAKKLDQQRHALRGASWSSIVLADRHGSKVAREAVELLKDVPQSVLEAAQRIHDLNEHRDEKAKERIRSEFLELARRNGVELT